jgi:hypothetical protein
MSDMRQFSEESLRRIQRDHTRLKTLADTLAVQQQQQQREGEIIRTVTGFTSTNSMFPTYPTASGHNTYVVKLRDYSFTPTTGVQTRSAQGNATRSIIARTWDGSSVTENTPVVCDLIYAIGKGPQWWIRPAAGTPSPNPVYVFSPSWRVTASGARPRGGSYSTTEYYTLDFAKYRGDPAANKIQLRDAPSSGDAFVRILETGWYLFDFQLSVSVLWQGSARESTLTTTVSNSTTPGHSHDVTAPTGKDFSSTVRSSLRYKLNNTGTATVINDSDVRMLAFSTTGTASSYDNCTGRFQYCLNLTAEWYIQLRVFFSEFQSTSGHEIDSASPTNLRIQYLGPTASDVNI